MKNIYLYGSSDDCSEIETDFNKGAESYGQLKINDIIADYSYDGDWHIELNGDIPSTWLVRKIRSNSDFIHIQVPDEEEITLFEPSEEEETKKVWKPV